MRNSVWSASVRIASVWSSLLLNRIYGLDSRRERGLTAWTPRLASFILRK